MKKLPDNAGDAGYAGLITGSGIFPAGGKGNPFHYSCLKHPMDKEEPGGLQATTEHTLMHTNQKT